MLRLSHLKAAMKLRESLGYGPGDALCTDKSGPPPILQSRGYENHKPVRLNDLDLDNAERLEAPLYNPRREI